MQYIDDAFRMPDRRRDLTEHELAWMIVLRSIFPGGVPAPRLRQVQDLQQAVRAGMIEVKDGRA